MRLPRNGGSERLQELLCDRALCGLSDAERRELEALAVSEGAGHADEFSEFDLAIGDLEAAMAEADAEVPEHVRSSIEAAGKAFLDDRALLFRAANPQSLRIESAMTTEVVVRPTRSRSAVIGWLVAAAAIAIAATVWIVNRPSVGQTRLLSVASVEDFVRTTPDAVRSAWGPFNALDTSEPPEVKGVSGEVVWSDSKQTGVMKFTGLPTNDATKEQYQLWIIDANRGISQRISGAVFNSRDGEVVVPIDPKIPVGKAAAFAITIEQPGGTWVSDMKRRVVLAAITR